VQADDIEPGKMYWGQFKPVRYVTEVSRTTTAYQVCYEKVRTEDETTGPYRGGTSTSESMERFLRWAHGEFKEGDSLEELQARE